MKILLTGGSRRFQGIHICGMADTPATAFRLCRERRPDLVILDTSPDFPLIDSGVIGDLKSVSEVIVLTVHSDPRIPGVIQVAKDSGIDAIVEVIRTASGLGEPASDGNFPAENSKNN
jgi:AmiR/NasT family two-component response regulator